MRQKAIGWIFVLNIIGFFVLGFMSISMAQEVVKITNGEWPPFTGKNLKHYGVYSHIVSKAFAIEGVKVEYGFFPWPRGYKYAKRGKWDGSITWAPTPEKEKEVLFSDSVFLHTKVFFHLKRLAFDWNTIEDLKKLQIGATAEYTYGDEFDKAAKDGTLNVYYVTRDLQNLQKLLSGRLHIFPSDIDVGYNLLNTNFGSREIVLVTHHTKPIQKSGTCLILTKVSPDKSLRLLKLFNRGLKKLKESGGYDQIVEASRRGEYLQE